MDEVAFGQLVVWDGREVIAKHQTTIEQTLAQMKPEWFMNVVSIEEGKSYFVAKDKALQSWLGELLAVEFDGFIAHADRLWLRKEVVKQALGTRKT